ncbi:anti-anti-sigma factor [Streptomyces lavendulae]|uniref:anti-anti-sigma factor n=1 Tax=Streptomyces lavendulae TaxID=1914 RepID=UPI00369C175B
MTGEGAVVTTTAERDATVISLRDEVDEDLDAQPAHAAAGVALVLAGRLHTAVRRLFEVTGASTGLRTADGPATEVTC